MLLLRILSSQAQVTYSSERLPQDKHYVAELAVLIVI